MTGLRERIDRLLTLMEKNERDRELSPYWRHGDGSMMTRAEWEASREWRDAMRNGPGYQERDFYGRIVEDE